MNNLVQAKQSDQTQIKTKSQMISAEDQCNKLLVCFLSIPYFNSKNALNALHAGFCVNIAEYLLFSSTISTWLPGKLRHVKLSREIHFISSLSLGLQCSRLHKHSFVVICYLNETLFFREQTTALPSPCEWDWEHSCASSPKHHTASRQQHSKIVLPPKVLVKWHQLDLATSLKWCIVLMC